MTSEFNVLDKWYHIAMVKEANRLLLYKDAVLIGTQSPASATIQSDGFYFGND